MLYRCPFMHIDEIISRIDDGDLLSETALQEGTDAASLLLGRIRKDHTRHRHRRMIEGLPQVLRFLRAILLVLRLAAVRSLHINMIVPEGRRLPAPLSRGKHHAARQIGREPVLQDRLARLAPHDPCTRVTNDRDIAQAEQRNLRSRRIPHASGGDDDLIAFWIAFWITSRE